MSARFQQRIALIAACIVLVAGVAGLIVELDEDGATLSIASPSPTPVATVATPTPAPAAPATVAPTAAPTAAPVATTPPPVTAPPNGGVNLPKPGVYTYRETGDGRFTRASLRISDTGAGKQKEGRGDIVTDVNWKTAGKYIDKITFENVECNFEPDTLEIKLPLTAGGAWDIDGDCDVGPGVSMEFSGTSRVTGTERVSIGGTLIDTWKLRSAARIILHAGGNTSEQQITSDDHFAPAAGLYVRSNTKTTGEDPFTGQPSDSTTLEELESLTPQSV